MSEKKQEVKTDMSGKKQDEANAKLDDLVESAVEAELDPDRHAMEMAVLATVARHGPAAEGLWQGFRDLDWSRPDFGAVAASLAESFGEGTGADQFAIGSKLREAGAVVKDDVLTGVLDGSNVRELAVAVRYVEIMDGRDRLRRADDTGRDYLARVEQAREGGEDADAAIAGLLEQTIRLARERRLVRERPNEAAEIDGFIRDLEERRSADRKWTGLDSGFKHLNEVLNGLNEGVLVLAGAPSTGKTTLAKQIADTVAAKENTPVLFWSFEQSKEELRIKSLARLAKVDSRSIWKGRTDEDEWENIREASGEYSRGAGSWLTVFEAGREDDPDRIRAGAVMAKHKAGGGKILLVLDYLQILPAGPKAPDTIRERVDWNLSELRRLSRDLQSPILVVSSQNREAYRSNRRPTLAALKESGGIEYTADAVVCLWRNREESDRLTKDFERPTIRVEAHVLKNRNGEPANIGFNFTPAWAMFDEQDRDALGYEDALTGTSE